MADGIKTDICLNESFSCNAADATQKTTAPPASSQPSSDQPAAPVQQAVAKAETTEAPRVLKGLGSEAQVISIAPRKRF